MEKQSVLTDFLGNVYISNNNIDEATKNYSFLLEEKIKLISYLHTIIQNESDVTLEQYQLDLLLLNSTPITYDDQNNIINYPTYYSIEELTLIDILKKISYNPESIIQEEYELLYRFFKNRLLIDNMLRSSGNGLRISSNLLSKLLKLFSTKRTTIGKNIKNYESLCKSLSLVKPSTNYKLEYKATA